MWRYGVLGGSKVWPITPLNSSLQKFNPIRRVLLVPPRYHKEDHDQVVHNLCELWIRWPPRFAHNFNTSRWERRRDCWNGCIRSPGANNLWPPYPPSDAAKLSYVRPWLIKWLTWWQDATPEAGPFQHVKIHGTLKLISEPLLSYID